jgi:hypothetical protein
MRKTMLATLMIALLAIPMCFSAIPILASKASIIMQFPEQKDSNVQLYDIVPHPLPQPTTGFNVSQFLTTCPPDKTYVAPK